VANAGPDQVITLPTDSVSLDGTSSSDPDGRIGSFLWTKISGPFAFSISNANAEQTPVADLAEGVYQFELKVTDAGGLFDTDTMQVIVQPQPKTNCDESNRPVTNAKITTTIHLPEPRYGIAVATVGNMIFIAGGYTTYIGTNPSNFSDRVDIYDVTTGQWTVKHLSEPRGGISVAVLGNKVFFAGSSTNGLRTTVDIYDVSNNTWNTSELSRAREAFAGGVIDNKVFFAGGVTWNFIVSGQYTEEVLSLVDIYDATTNLWSTASLSQPRLGSFVTTVGHKIFFAGGQSTTLQDSWSARIDVYDAATNIWSHEDYIPLNTNNGLPVLSAGLGVGNKNYWVTQDYWGMDGRAFAEIRDETTSTISSNCLSGWSGTPVENSNKVLFPVRSGNVSQFDVYDLATDSWSISKLPFQDFNFLISVNNKVYTLGGSFAGNGYLYDKVYKLEL
jgi:hypothetical protein